MPFAKGVSAKTFDFDEQGNESSLDYDRLLKIVLAAGFEGDNLSEADGINATKTLLQRIQADQ
ncbi:hypothetical protein HQ531_07030 [bacterium]|nr:hypothetical protein [bacterium]